MTVQYFRKTQTSIHGFVIEPVAKPAKDTDLISPHGFGSGYFVAPVLAAPVARATPAKAPKAIEAKPDTYVFGVYESKLPAESPYQKSWSAMTHTEQWVATLPEAVQAGYVVHQTPSGPLGYFAKVYIERACAERGVRMPEIKWFTPAKYGEHSNTRGVAQYHWHQVWLSTTISLDRLPVTCGHEIAHLSGIQDEDRAEQYGLDFAARLYQ